MIRVPEAEPLVGEWRRRFDPSAVLGIPAHITVVYPFVPGEEVDAGIRAELRGLFAEVSPCRFELRAPARFPSVLYLDPEPDGALRAIIEGVVERFPEHPPYGGAFEELAPISRSRRAATRICWHGSSPSSPAGSQWRSKSPRPC